MYVSLSGRRPSILVDRGDVHHLFTIRALDSHTCFELCLTFITLILHDFPLWEGMAICVTYMRLDIIENITI